jgi:hypothetical protein
VVTIVDSPELLDVEAIDDEPLVEVDTEELVEDRDGITPSTHANPFLRRPEFPFPE